jgi:RNA recognition motif-containing protein
MLIQPREQDKEATVYIGNLDERVSDSLVWELMLQVGRIVNVHLPKDRVTQLHQGYGFVEFISEEDAEYASKIMNGIRLHGKPIRVNKASADKQKTVEIGAELFVGNLDPMVAEQVLFDTFSRFGNLVNPPKVRSPPDIARWTLLTAFFFFFCYYYRLPVMTTISLRDMDLFLLPISNPRTRLSPT